jgi:hypothetical protein
MARVCRRIFICQGANAAKFKLFSCGIAARDSCDCHHGPILKMMDFSQKIA